MSLFDIDKHNDNRREPRPNENDQQSNRMAHNTMGTTYRNDGDVNFQRIIFKNGLILSYDDQNRVIKIDGFEPRLVPYPVVIQAKYGFDVYEDILGITAPET